MSQKLGKRKRRELELTPETKERLLDLARQIRQIIVGNTLHPGWDYVFDIEAFANKRPAILNLSAAEWVIEAETYLKDLRRITA